MKYVTSFLFVMIIVASYGGCGSNNNENINTSDLDNLCFIPDSENPCSDPNTGGEMRFAADKTAEEVIAEEENEPGFVGSLRFDEILSVTGRSIFLPPVREGCMWEDSGLVIKSSRQWDLYRNNCYFTDNFFTLPDVDFEQNMVLVSLDGNRGFGTEIVSVLEFQDKLVAVIEDTVDDVASPEAKFFGSHVIELTRKDLSVDFIRIEDVCNSLFNLENSECLAESLTNVCEFLICRFDDGRFNIKSPNCEAIDCSGVSCDEIIIESGIEDIVVNGIVTDLSLNPIMPMGILNFNDQDMVVGCSLIVE